jgi:hypothetical protein
MDFVVRVAMIHGGRRLVVYANERIYDRKGNQQNPIT